MLSAELRILYIKEMISYYIKQIMLHTFFKTLIDSLVDGSVYNDTLSPHLSELFGICGQVNLDENEPIKLYENICTTLMNAAASNSNLPTFKSFKNALIEVENTINSCFGNNTALKFDIQFKNLKNYNLASLEIISVKIKNACSEIYRKFSISGFTSTHENAQFELTRLSDKITYAIEKMRDRFSKNSPESEYLWVYENSNYEEFWSKNDRYMQEINKIFFLDTAYNIGYQHMLRSSKRNSDFFLAQELIDVITAIRIKYGIINSSLAIIQINQPYMNDLSFKINKTADKNNTNSNKFGLTIEATEIITNFLNKFGLNIEATEIIANYLNKFKNNIFIKNDGYDLHNKIYQNKYFIPEANNQLYELLKIFIKTDKLLFKEELRKLLLEHEAMETSKYTIKKHRYYATWATTIVKFSEEVTKPDANFLLSLLQTTRENLSYKLSLLKEQEHARTLLSDEIVNAFTLHTQTQGGKGLNPPPDSKWDKLHSALNIVENQLTELCEVIRCKIPLSDPKKKRAFIESLEKEKKILQAEALDNLCLAVSEAKKAVTDYCMTIDVYSYYISSLKQKNVWIGYKTATLYGEQANINLYIWEFNPKVKDNIIMVNGNLTSEGSSRELHLLHKGGFSRLSLLEPSIKKNDQSLNKLEESKSPDVDILAWYQHTCSIVSTFLAKDSSNLYYIKLRDVAKALMTVAFTAEKKDIVPIKIALIQFLELIHKHHYKNGTLSKIFGQNDIVLKFNSALRSIESSINKNDSPEIIMEKLQKIKNKISDNQNDYYSKESTYSTVAAQIPFSKEEVEEKEGKKSENLLGNVTETSLEPPRSSDSLQISASKTNVTQTSPTTPNKSNIFKTPDFSPILCGTPTSTTPPEEVGKNLMEDFNSVINSSESPLRRNST